MCARCAGGNNAGHTVVVDNFNGSSEPYVSVFLTFNQELGAHLLLGHPFFSIFYLQDSLIEIVSALSGTAWLFMFPAFLQS